MEWRLFGDLSGRGAVRAVTLPPETSLSSSKHSPYPDLDCLDQSAWHLVVRVAGSLAGYLRLMPITGPPPLVRVGRSCRVVAPATARDWPSHNGGRPCFFCRKLLCGANRSPSPPSSLWRRFYQSFGFSATSAPYDDFGVEHVEMALAAPKLGGDVFRQRHAFRPCAPVGLGAPRRVPELFAVGQQIEYKSFIGLPPCGA